MLPKLVTQLTTVCNAWVVGSAVDNQTPRDYDIYVPIGHWRTACCLMPSNARVNRMGGFKCISEDIEVDVWTGDMSDFLASDYFTKALHPQTGVKIIRELPN